jgi:hypothetical protein
MFLGNTPFIPQTNTPGSARMERSYYESITQNQAFWQEADYNNRVYAGDADVWNLIMGGVPNIQRRQLSFNRVRRVVNLMSGFQRRNRKSMVAIPIENADNQTADEYTKILMWLDQKEGILDTISTAFHSSLISGMSLLSTWIDYRNDPISGDIKFGFDAYSSFLIDPYYRNRDFSDCNYIWKRQYHSRRTVISMLPDKEDEILSLPSNLNGPSKDQFFQYMPENYAFNISDLVAYDEYYYRAYRKQKMLIDRQTGEALEWTHDDESLKLFIQTYPNISVIENTIPTVNLTIAVQNRVMYDGPNPLNTDRYPYVGVFAYFNPDLPYYQYRIQGVVNDLRDAQWLYNRRKAIELDILESQPNSGFIYKEDALVDPNDIFKGGQGKGIALKKSAQLTDLQQILPPALPPTTFEVSKLLAEEIIQISGGNEELFGSATDDKSGILSMLRQGAGLTTLQILFDQLDHSQKLAGELLLELIQKNYTPGKVKRILNGAEPSPQFYNQAFGKYGVTVEEGANTVTQRQMQLLQMLQLREIGVPISNTSILKAANLTNKQEIIDEMNQQEQAQQQSLQQQNEMAMQEMQARIEAMKSKSAADQGLAVERSSRVEENKALAVERESKAHLDEQTGILNIVKALKEIDGIDLSHVEKLFKLNEALKAQEAAQEEMQPQNYQQQEPVFPETPGMYAPDGSVKQQYMPQEEPPMSADANNQAPY